MAAFRAQFNLEDTPPPPPPDPDPIPDDDTPTGVMYRVTAVPSLKVREGPGVTYNAIGLLYTNDVVEEINANADRSWLKIRKTDGSLLGWSSSAYLENISGTPPPVEKRMYRVTASPSLKVRAGPGLSYPSIGTNPYNSIVEEVDANADRTWLKVKELKRKSDRLESLLNICNIPARPLPRRLWTRSCIASLQHPCRFLKNPS